MKIEHLHNYGQVNMADYIDAIHFTPTFPKERFEQFVQTLELNPEQTTEIQQIAQSVDTQGLDEAKVTALLERLEQGIEAIKDKLPVPITSQIEEVKKLQTGMSLDGKFKTTIPIIPGILNYEFEAKNNLKDIFKQIWQEMKNGEIFLKKK